MITSLVWAASILRWMPLFGHFGIKHYALHDGDDGKYAATVEKLLATLLTTFTGGVDTFIKDIESYLSITSAGKPLPAQKIKATLTYFS